jgi:hypothetical protein
MNNTSVESQAHSAVPEALSPSVLCDLLRGYRQYHYGPFQRTSCMRILYSWSANDVREIGHFAMTCDGMLNGGESTSLQIANYSVKFLRDGYNGKWQLDGKTVATMQLSFGRRFLHWGRSRILMCDGTSLTVPMPIIGPSMKQVFNCVSNVEVSNGSRIKLFWTRPDSELQFIFDHRDIPVLEQLSKETRAVLLGEFCRVRSFYT